MEQFNQSINNSQSGTAWQCPECETINSGSQCYICGHPKPQEQKPDPEPEKYQICPRCHGQNSVDAVYCSTCGKKLEKGNVSGLKKPIMICAIIILLLLLSMGFQRPLTSLFHVHSWQTATCTTPKTCTACNATAGTSLGHDWKDATCTAARTCKRCGSTTGTPLAHNWTEATFDAPKTCTLCAKTSGAKMAAPTLQTTSVTVADGKKATVTVTATGSSLSYQWYYKDPGDSGFLRDTSMNGKTYSVSMSSSVNGRQVYCKVTDSSGASADTGTATLHMEKKTLTITSQPQSVTVEEGKTAKVTVAATGDGLTYKWYYKNAGASEYTYTSSFNSNYYSVEMNAARNGRRVLCKITDKYGNTVQSSSALLSMKSAAKTADKDYIGTLSGSSAPVTLRDGNSTMNIHALVLTKKVQKCTKMTVNMNVDMKAGTSCKEWQLWGRNNGSFQKIGKINLPDGNGFTSQTLTFKTPVTFDAIAITPTVPGGYSWSLGFTLTDVYGQQ